MTPLEPLILLAVAVAGASLLSRRVGVPAPVLLVLGLTTGTEAVALAVTATRPEGKVHLR